ncbi:MAG: hypothetical protein HYY67_05400 [Thaumarchaeota archaeon]|nr:hypothetical protein [Nitrososphaerota archaeon]
MAIVKLNRVTLVCPKSELRILSSRLCEFTAFHPSDRRDLVDDPELLHLSSRAHFVYSEANELLTGQPLEQEQKLSVRSMFRARDLLDLVNVLTKELVEIKFELGQPDSNKSETYLRLRAMREAALAVFNNVRRIKVLPSLKRFVAIEGFIPSHLVESFRTHIQEYLVSAEPVKGRLSLEPYIPSLIVNPRVISLFENIALAGGVPRYNEIDPTPIIAFVFPAFFGIMFADLGHGMVLLALGLSLAFRGKGKYRYWGRVLAVLGLAAVATGSITGIIFGFDFPTPFSHLFPFSRILAGPFSPDSALLLLEVAVIIGTFHLASAYAIAVINQIRSRNYIDALLNHLPTLLLYSSAVPFTLALSGVQFQWQEIFVSNSSISGFEQLLGWHVPVSLVAIVSFPILTGSFLTLILGRPLAYLAQTNKHGKVVKAIGEGLAEAILRPIEFLGNTISYARLGVLLIVSTALGSLVNRVLELGILGIPLAAVLHIGQMALEGLIVYIQDLRLHLYEWLSKFYFGLGIPFTPLALRGETFEIRWT